MTPEPAQPAESPEARALTILDVPPVSPPPNSNGILCFACGKRVEHTSAGYCFSCIATFNVPDAATTARPTERGAVEAVWNALSERVGVACDAECNGDLGRHDIGCQRATALLNAHSAALTPPVTVAATDQAGEVERERTAHIVHGAWRADDEIKRLRVALNEIDVLAGTTLPSDGPEAAFAALEGIIKLIHPFRVNAAALATQPATGRTMGGEERFAGSDILDEFNSRLHDLIEFADRHDMGHGLVISELQDAIAALQNGGE